MLCRFSSCVQIQRHPRWSEATSRPRFEETLHKAEGFFSGSPDGIRTRVTGLKGRRPRPLDDGAIGFYARKSAKEFAERGNDSALSSCRIHHPIRMTYTRSVC